MRISGYINLDKQIGVNITTFPDKQPHVQISQVEEIFMGMPFEVVCSLTDPLKLIYLVQTANALDHLFVKKLRLFIPYLMGARSDRVMERGDSFDLQVVANLINLCGFEEVILFDVHSDVATALIKNSTHCDNRYLVKKYSINPSVLICPDAGATKKIPNYLRYNDEFKEVVYCIKNREPHTRNITLKVINPELCTGKNCVIIDDICDGGRTFIEIAKQIHPHHLTLIVTHGIFSQGFEELEKYFDHIIVSNSYSSCYSSSIVEVVETGR